MRTGIRSRDRMEVEAQRRRARAQSHLERLRQQRRTRGAAPLQRTAGLAVAVGIAAAFGAWGGGELFAGWGGPGWQVARVEVHGAARLTGAEIARAAGIAPGDDFAAADPDRIAEALGRHGWIAEARAARLPRGTVVLGVREREPVGVIAGQGGPLGVDAEGRPFAVLEESEAEGLPRLDSDEAAIPGEPNPRLAEALRVARALPERGLAMPWEVHVASARDAEGIVLRLPGFQARFVLGSEELDARVDTLAELIAHRSEEVSSAAQVDLRFAGQAILQGKADPEGKAQEARWRGGAGSSATRPRG